MKRIYCSFFLLIILCFFLSSESVVYAQKSIDFSFEKTGPNHSVLVLPVWHPVIKELQQRVSIPTDMVLGFDGDSLETDDLSDVWHINLVNNTTSSVIPTQSTSVDLVIVLDIGALPSDSGSFVVNVSEQDGDLYSTMTAYVTVEPSYASSLAFNSQSNVLHVIFTSASIKSDFTASCTFSFATLIISSTSVSKTLDAPHIFAIIPQKPVPHPKSITLLPVKNLSCDK